jgi:hypothetical protein
VSLLLLLRYGGGGGGGAPEAPVAGWWGDTLEDESQTDEGYLPDAWFSTPDTGDVGQLGPDPGDDSSEIEGNDYLDAVWPGGQFGSDVVAAILDADTGDDDDEDPQAVWPFIDAPAVVVTDFVQSFLEADANDDDDEFEHFAAIFDEAAAPVTDFVQSDPEALEDDDVDLDEAIWVGAVDDAPIVPEPVEPPRPPGGTSKRLPIVYYKRRLPDYRPRPLPLRPAPVEQPQPVVINTGGLDWTELDELIRRVVQELRRLDAVGQIPASGAKAPAEQEKDLVIIPGLTEEESVILLLMEGFL